jgi:hypothetical protein
MAVSLEQSGVPTSPLDGVTVILISSKHFKYILDILCIYFSRAILHLYLPGSIPKAIL